MDSEEKQILNEILATLKGINDNLADIKEHLYRQAEITERQPNTENAEPAIQDKVEDGEILPLKETHDSYKITDHTIITSKKALRQRFNIGYCSHRLHQLPAKLIAEWHQLRTDPHKIAKHSVVHYVKQPCPQPDPQRSIEGLYAQATGYAISFNLPVPRDIPPLVEGAPIPMMDNGSLKDSSGLTKSSKEREHLKIGFLIELLADRNTYPVKPNEGTEHLRVGLRYLLEYRTIQHPKKRIHTTGMLTIVETVPGVEQNVVGVSKEYATIESLQDHSRCDVMNKFWVWLDCIPPNDETGAPAIKFSDIEYGELVVQANACYCCKQIWFDKEGTYDNRLRAIDVSSGSATIDVRFKDDGTVEMVR